MYANCLYYFFLDFVALCNYCLYKLLQVDVYVYCGSTVLIRCSCHLQRPNGLLYAIGFMYGNWLNSSHDLYGHTFRVHYADFFGGLTTDRQTAVCFHVVRIGTLQMVFREVAFSPFQANFCTTFCKIVIKVKSFVTAVCFETVFQVSNAVHCTVFSPNNRSFL